MENGKKNSTLKAEVSTNGSETSPAIHDNFVWNYFMGDTPGISAWVDQKTGALKWTLRFIESILRTFGALIFVNNVWSGGFFCLAVFIHDPFSALLGVFGIIVSYFTGILLKVYPERLRNGVATFNGFMVAQFIGTVSIPVAGVRWNPWLLFPAAFFSVISTIIKSALHSFLHLAKLPALNFPFSLTTLCFLASQASQPAPTFPASLNPLPPLINATFDQHHDATSVFRGIFFSISNIYGCNNVISVTLAWIGVLVASPLLCAMCLAGSCTGTGIAIVMGVSKDQLASGMWSFNSLLVCGSVGGFFYVWNKFSCVVAVFAAATACVVAGTLYHILGFVNLPFQAIPLFLTDAIFLSALAAYKPNHFIRVNFEEIHYPEMHRQVHLRKKMLTSNSISIAP